ncbi:hypothetical protein FOV72_20130 [Gordonia rubripertincta]|uniref:hypothetical protein n=1 Tax=Gordonia rubripertincta TaxID=36822 RepID=UPI00117FA5DA|nr:hypothetical protein [Gordonia rubripertincta]TSD93278.1 hypothetical protein FOV72_20130 [Gordonia rubripertincta]
MSDQLRAGATNLSRIEPTLVGSFYAALFPLSIGYERLAKIALQVDARLETGEFLTTREMRDVGHKINGLFTQVEGIATRRGYTGVKYERPTDVITNAITAILTEFAVTGRYNHLDSLGSPGVSASAERQWDEQVMLPIAARHLTLRAEQKIASHAAAIDSSFSATEDLGVIAFHHDVNGTFHTGPASMYMRSALYAKLIPYARMYAFRPGRWLAYIVDRLATEAISSPHTCGHVPYLIEFFPWLKGPDDFFQSRRNPGK